MTQSIIFPSGRIPEKHDPINTVLLPLIKDYTRDHETNCGWRGIVNEKLERASPYCLFLTRVKDSVPTYVEDLTITFPELLDKSLGELEHSVHINFMVDLDWLMAQYGANDILFSPMTILCGVEDDFLNPRRLEWNVRSFIIEPTSRFGRMHTKMSMFFYTDYSVRFAIYSANLTESDWTNRTQGVWISPKCPFMGDNVPINFGESSTLFKYDIIKFLDSYEQPTLWEWIYRIQRCDLSAIKVCLVASVPGEHTDSSFGYKKLNKLINEYVSLPSTNEWDYVVQASSLGYLGTTPHAWFDTFSRSMRADNEEPPVLAKVIFPTNANVLGSLDGLGGASCLPYTNKIHNTQRWLRNYLHQWKCDHRHRTKALPHIKSYARVSTDGTKVAWFMLTSANLSKAAWGTDKKGDGSCTIFSHELGVLFLPAFFNGGNTFNVRKGGFVTTDKESFPLPYDTPLEPYAKTDSVFLNTAF